MSTQSTEFLEKYGYSFKLTDWLEDSRLIPYFPIAENNILNLRAIKLCSQSDVDKMPDVGKIVFYSCDYWDVPERALKGKGRKHELVYARHLIHFLAKEHTKMSWKKIGNLTNKDHSTAMHSHKKINELLLRDKEVQEAVREIETKIFPTFIRTAKPMLPNPPKKAYPELINASMYVSPLPVKSKFSRFSTE